MFAKYDLHAMHTRTVQVRAHSHVHACSEVQRTSTGQPKYTCTPQAQVRLKHCCIPAYNSSVVCAARLQGNAKRGALRREAAP